MGYILKAKNQKHAKSAKHQKSNTHIFKGLKTPIDDKKFKTKNNIKRQSRLTGLLSGFDMTFKDESEFKEWLKSFNMSGLKPVNCRHNTDPIIRAKNPNLYIGHFDLNIGFNI